MPLLAPMTPHLPPLCLLLTDGVPDLHTLLPKRSGAWLSTDLSRGTVLGLIPSGEAVWSASVPLSHIPVTSHNQPLKAVQPPQAGQGQGQGQGPASPSQASPYKGGRLVLKKQVVSTQLHSVNRSGKVWEIYTMRLVSAGTGPGPLRNAPSPCAPAANGTAAATATAASPAVPSMAAPLVTSLSLSLDLTQVRDTSGEAGPVANAATANKDTLATAAVTAAGASAAGAATAVPAVTGSKRAREQQQQQQATQQVQEGQGQQGQGQAATQDQETKRPCTGTNQGQQQAGAAAAAGSGPALPVDGPLDASLQGCHAVIFRYL